MDFHNAYRLPFAAFLLPILFLFASCDRGGSETEIAQASFRAEITFLESGEPVTNSDVEVIAFFEEANQEITLGTLTTDSEGFIEETISSYFEQRILTLTFNITHNGTEYSREEQVNLDLRFNMPYNHIDLPVTID